MQNKYNKYASMQKNGVGNHPFQILQTQDGKHALNYVIQISFVFFFKRRINC